MFNLICSRCGIIFNYTTSKKKYCYSCYKLNRKESSKKYKSSNKEKIFESHCKYYEVNKERILKYGKDWKAKNSDKIKTTRNKKNKIKRETDVLYKLKDNISRGIRRSFKRKNLGKKDKSYSYIGLSKEEFVKYLESLFIDGMTWDNYGTFWDIDHIIPLCTAKTEEDLKKLWHYTNLRPLNSYYNRYIKRHRIILSEEEQYLLNNTGECLKKLD